jgi:SAM-dependent methyltransferase
MAPNFDVYVRKLRETPVAEQTEHTSRSALEELLRSFAPVGPTAASVQHEPKREADKGAPDFKIKRRGMILGYVEVKEIGANLDKVLKSDQIRRYRELSDNILLTDYLQWIWIDRDHVKGREILAYPSDLESRTVRLRPERVESVGNLIAAFFSEPPQGIGRAQQLALSLAARARLLRDFLTIELTRQEAEHREGRLFALFEVFRSQVFHELTTKEFADAFAQMLAYGLFLARLNAGADDTVTLENVRNHIPGSFRLIRELVRFIEEMNEGEYSDARWIVEEVLSIVNGLILTEIQEDLSFRQRRAISRNVRAGDEEEHRLFEKDPFIYFYEDFLKAYDPAMRKGRGVYYTPPPIVNFIVRAVDDILKATFGVANGLADHSKVTVLDFACGTGTFLLEVFERIFENIGGPDSGRAEPVVREHILRNIFGFEYLIAPYTIAHLKLSQYLKDKGHVLVGDERLQVYLTNTLEPIEPQRNLMLPAVAAEVEAAQEVKDREILVITGNPPYSGHSKNKGVWITRQIDGYKYTIERRADLIAAEGLGPEEEIPLGERNSKWLNDDYVKFIRFAQLKMDAASEGIVGVITNHSWLDNPTFRGVRQSLMRSFDQIYLLDLHGSTKPKEPVPLGFENQNVFDIQKGVSISLLVKRRGTERGVWHADLWGTRLEKYRAAAAGKMSTVSWQRLEASHRAARHRLRRLRRLRRRDRSPGALCPGGIVRGSPAIRERWCASDDRCRYGRRGEQARSKFGRALRF